MRKKKNEFLKGIIPNFQQTSILGNMNKNQLTIRQKIWIETFNSVASASNSTKMEVSAAWADYALKEFEKRFTIL